MKETATVLKYDVPDWLTAFTTGRDGSVSDMGLLEEELALPRQTHSDHILWMNEPGRPEDTDAVITDCPGLCLCVKTADCIPVLLYDAHQRVVAAVHAGWRGTVARIAEKTARMMTSRPKDLHVIIGPGISQESFQVKEDVHLAFLEAGFSGGVERMEMVGDAYEPRWYIDLWEANCAQLLELGVQRENVHVSGICTMKSFQFYSARRETIHTGRNMNCIMINIAVR